MGCFQTAAYSASRHFVMKRHALLLGLFVLVAPALNQPAGLGFGAPVFQRSDLPVSLTNLRSSALGYARKIAFNNHDQVMTRRTSTSRSCLPGCIAP
jgi:hypothetical protein